MASASILALLGSASAMASDSLTSDEKLFWGTYRPIPYVGLRSRATDSPLIGLMWNTPVASGVKNLRHECSYYDNMAKYGWENHDGVGYAKQTIDDAENNVSLTVEWVKPELETDPNHWVLRVSGEDYATPLDYEQGQSDQ